MRKLNALIVDDERLAREELKQHLRPYFHLFNIMESADADSAEQLIRNNEIDLIFLDIQLPEKSGFDLLESLDKIPEIIFATAFDQYAVKAFEHNAVDYLLKPVRTERFARAMEKLLQKLSGIQEQSLFIKDKEMLHFIKPSSIISIESKGNYASLHLSTGKLLIRKSLNQLEEILDRDLFFRINRNFLVNTNQIKALEADENNRLLITMNNAEKLAVSVRQSTIFKNRNKL